MKFLVIIALCIFNAESRPNGAVEIEKQKLIKLPEPSQDQREEKHLEETKRILEQIDKINAALGYTKRAFTVSSKIGSNEGYFYPKATFTPIQIRNSGSSVRDSPFLARKITHKSIELLPSIFNQQSYFYPTPYLQLPSTDIPRLFREININNENTFLIATNENIDKKGERLLMKNPTSKQSYRTIVKDMIDIIELIPNIIEDQKSLTRQSKTEIINETAKRINSKKNKQYNLKSSIMDDIYDVISEDEDDEEDEKTASDIEITLQNDKYIMGENPNGRQDLKEEDINNSKVGQPAIINSKPLGIKVGTKPIKKPLKDQNENNKGPFGIFNSNQETKDAIKEGGIVIQRLKVRKGGIAIAGPGGVATAGSGGTAIVGPGGLAFTHPRGLTIAGPGAKIIAVPATTDLEQAALNASARNLPMGGVLVATGPIVYYSPDV